MNAANEVIFQQVTQANETMKEQLNAVQYQTTMQSQMHQHLLKKLQAINSAKQGSAPPTPPRKQYQVPPLYQYQASPMLPFYTWPMHTYMQQTMYQHQQEQQQEQQP